MPVDEIRSETFKGFPCTTVYIHGNIRKLGKAVFQNSTVQNVLFEDGITVLPEYGFSRCENLKKVELPKTVKIIRTRCFEFCKKLKYVGFPKSISFIEDAAFVASGIERFGVECFTPGINNADSFFNTPLFFDIPEQVVCTFPDQDNLTVLRVRRGSFKLKADSVTFLQCSLHNTSLDLSECGNVRFYRYAVRDERPREKRNVGYYCEPSIIKLPKNREYNQFYPFPKHVNVINYFQQNDKPYQQPYKMIYNVKENLYEITPVADFLPPWSVRENVRKLRICKGVKIERRAIQCRQLQEITFEDFSPEDRVFSACDDLRKVSFSHNGRMYTKYIPPSELIPLHGLILKAFAPCSAPCGNGFRRTVYDRRIIDSIFNSRVVSSDNNPWLRTDLKRIAQTCNGYTRRLSMRVGNKIKAVIAIDVLKSDRLDHEPPVDMYYQFLNNHRNFCLHYFQKISDLFPEYLAAFEKIILHPGNTD